MRKRKKITKLWIVLTLVVSLLAVQTMQIMAEASTGTADLSNPTVVVNDIAELQNAVANANDGDVIGINTLISITTDIGQLGSVESGKYLYLVRMNENARFEITQQGNQEDNSQSHSTTETHEDKSTTTNNYYTYNTPAANTPATNSSNKQDGDTTSKKTDTEASKKSDSTEAGNDSSAPSANTQIPDNIKLDLYNVNIVYEMESGVSNIAISNEPEKVEETINADKMAEAVTEPVVLASATATEEPESVNWYEVIKLILLAAIFIVVVPKPALKKEK